MVEMTLKDFWQAGGFGMYQVAAFSLTVFIATVRFALHPDERDAYSYWDAWRDRRARNIGWRIDYVMVDHELMPKVKQATG